MAVRTNKEKIDNIALNSNINIVTDAPTKDASDFQKYAMQLSKLIVNKNSTPRFTVGIYGGWGTGKTTVMQMIKDEIDRNYSDNVQTVWFDAWRFEKEQHSAMVPLLRTIILTLKNTKINSKDSEKKKILTRIEKQFTKIGGAIIRNTTVNVGANIGANIEAQVDIGKSIDDYKSDGSFLHGQERIYFHKHITDNLKEELQKIRKQSKYNDFKIVVFVDDLDRCTPDRALELLESIKSFFDIEGIVYVIGIDPSTIDPIIKTKYGEDSKINGMHYLQKIVQLPFQIPVWDATVLSKKIRTMIASTGMPISDFEPILKETSTELIIKAAQLNPRDIKRFVNSIILATYVYEHDIKDIEKIIAVQAFYFRGSGWLKFLRLLIPYKNRIQFLKHFILLIEKESEKNNVLALVDLKKITHDDIQEKGLILDQQTLEIYKKLVELDDEDLFLFLKVSASALIKIDRINKYLRVVEEATSANKETSFDTNGEKQLELLKSENVTEFNESVRLGNNLVSLIHLPYENLNDLKLENINLGNTFLFKTKLSHANLCRANLFHADLSGADLSFANLSHTTLSGADLSHAKISFADLSHAFLGENVPYGYLSANLSGATLSGANLSNAYLGGANLSGANLSNANLSNAGLGGANLSNAYLGPNLPYATLSFADVLTADLSAGLGATLSNANLSGANLSNANLSGANLSNANLSGANLSNAYLLGANLSNANLSGANLSNAILVRNKYDQSINQGTDFNNAVIDNPEYIKYLHSNGGQNIPDEIKSRQGLRSMLEKRNLDERLESLILSISDLQ